VSADRTFNTKSKRNYEAKCNVHTDACNVSELGWHLENQYDTICRNLHALKNWRVVRFVYHSQTIETVNISNWKCRRRDAVFL